MPLREQPVVQRGPGVPRPDVSVHALVMSRRLLSGQPVRDDAVTVDVRHGRARVLRLRRDGVQRRHLRLVCVQRDHLRGLLHRRDVRDGPDEPRVRAQRRGVRVVRRGLV